MCHQDEIGAVYFCLVITYRIPSTTIVYGITILFAALSDLCIDLKCIFIQVLLVERHEYCPMLLKDHVLNKSLPVLLYLV